MTTPAPDIATEALGDAAEVLADVQPKRLSAYPAYHDSNIDWIGEVPDHWHLYRAKWTVTACRNGIWGSEPDSENDIACVRVADFDRTRLRVIVDSPTMRAVTSRERQGRALKPGDLLLEKSGGGELQPVGAVMVFDHEIEAVCSNFVARMPVAKGYDTWFLAYLHSHLYAGRVNTRSIKQSIGIQNLDSRQYLDEVITHPPLDEQRAIAGFLRRETAKIDGLVEKKRRLIELLREKRTALISHAVTKGLNRDAPMKPSGIDWLGDVPKHWEIKRLRFAAKINPVKSEVSKLLPDTEVSFVPMEAVHEFGGMDLSQTKLIDDVYQGYTYFRDGDIVIAKITPCFENGKGVIADGLTNGVGFGTTELHVVRPKPELNHRYLFYVTMSTIFRHAGEGEMYGAGGQKRVPDSFIRNYRVPIPPPDEQAAILKHLDAEWQRIDRLTDQIGQVIERLNEYRSALISAAVTGKIDVRGEVVAL